MNAPERGELVAAGGEIWAWVLEPIDIPVSALESWRATIKRPDGTEDDLGRFDSRVAAQAKIKAYLNELPGMGE